MAELEMINHMKKSLGAFSNKDHKWPHRLKEFFTEILIIVFAVSLSIWFHELSEHHKEQKEVQYFLRELYKDLDYDLKLYEKAKSDFQQTANGYTYIAHLPDALMASADSIDYYRPFLFEQYTPIPTQGRYQSFKNSGKINLIEHALLEGDILDLFEEDIVGLDLKISEYGKWQDRFMVQMIQQTKRDHLGNNALLVYASNESVNYSKILCQANDIQQSYDQCIAKIRKINQQILEEIGSIDELH